jgi:hypothetical protein
LLLEVLLVQAPHSLLPLLVGNEAGWYLGQLQLVLNLHGGTIQVYARVGLRAPFILEVEVDCLTLSLLLPSASVLMGHLLLHPGLEPDVELPTPLLQLQGRKVLLIGALLVVEGKEETF